MYGSRTCCDYGKKSCDFVDCQSSVSCLNFNYLFYLSSNIFWIGEYGAKWNGYGCFLNWIKMLFIVEYVKNLGQLTKPCFENMEILKFPNLKFNPICNLYVENNKITESPWIELKYCLFVFLNLFSTILNNKGKFSRTAC